MELGFLGGGGRVPLGIGSNGTTNYSSVEVTGGAEQQNLSHSHTVNSHTHGMSHTHTVNSHAHTTAGHTLTISEIPAHSHAMKYLGSTSGSSTGWYGNSGSYNHSVRTYDTGGGESHSHGDTGYSSPATNTGTKTTTDGSSPSTTSSLGSVSILSPYITCYMWKRTA